MRTDQGLFTVDYQLDSIDFNMGEVQSQSLLLQNNQFFSYGIVIGFNQQTYYRKNIKFSDIMASLGGMLHIFMILGKFFCLAYNSAIWKYKIINYTFSNLEKFLI